MPRLTVTWGIVFARIEPNDQMILEKWISELRDRQTMYPPIN